MATVRSALARNFLSALAVAALMLTSCAAQQPAESDDSGSASASPSPSPADTAANEGDVLVAEVDDPVEFEVCKEAEKIEGATVEWLEDVVIEEQHIDGVEAQIVELEGQEVEIPGAPGIVIPARVAQAGCIIEYPAPGGCLPAVEISGGVYSRIPNP